MGDKDKIQGFDFAEWLKGAVTKRDLLCVRGAGAVARVTCGWENELGYETGPISVLSHVTDSKGYFFATLSLGELGYGSEKLDYMFASESTVPEAAVLSVNRSVEVGGEDGRGGKSEETGTFEDCDGGIVAVGSESRVAEASVSSVEGLVGVSTEDRRGGMKEEEGIDENCDEDAVATASESRAAEAAVLSVDNLVRVVGEDGSVEGINEEDGKDVDCDGNIVAVASESREAEASILSVDSLIGIGGEVVRDGGESEEVEKDEDCNGNILTLESESRVAEAADLIVDSSVGLGGEDKTERGESEEEEKDEDCGGNIVTIEVPVAETSENMDVDVEDLSVEGYGFVVSSFCLAYTFLMVHLFHRARIDDCFET